MLLMVQSGEEDDRSMYWHSSE